MEEIERIRPMWESLQWHPNSDVDAYLRYMGAHEGTSRPLLVVVKHLGVPCLLVVGRLEEIAIECRLGYLRLFSLKRVGLAVQYGGILGEVTDETARAVVGHLRKELALRRIEIAFFNHLIMPSPFQQAVLHGFGALQRDGAVSRNKHWRMSIPASLEEFYLRQSSKRRYWLRRIGRTIEQDFRGEVEFRCFIAPEEVAQACADMETVARRTYQRGLSVGFEPTSARLDSLRYSASRGWMRSYVLYLRGRPCAFWLGSLYAGVFYLDSTGYDPEFRKYEVGTVAFLRMISDLCGSMRARELDFGFGDALYKRKFGERCVDELSLYVYSYNLLLVLANLLRSTLSYVAEGLRAVLGFSGLVLRIKRVWRDRLRL